MSYADEFKRVMLTTYYKDIPLEQISPHEKYDVIMARVLLETIERLEKLEAKA